MSKRVSSKSPLRVRPVVKGEKIIAKKREVKVEVKKVENINTKSVNKKKCTKNIYEIIQFKKMIGKGLIVPYKGVPASSNVDIKSKILSGSVKTIGMSGFVSSGVIHIFDGVDRLAAINSISYSDIKKAKLDIDICINQYAKMTPLDLI
jgi:hypothetical protein